MTPSPISRPEVLDFVLGLYGAARGASAAEFPDRALRMLRTVVPFRTALWTEARFTGRSVEFHSAHPIDEPPEMLSEFVEFNRMHPITVAEVAQVPGAARTFYAPALYTGAALAGFRDYVRRYAHERHLLIADIESPAARGNWLSLYRPDGWDDFGDRDRRLISVLMPHLSEAFAVNRALLLRNEAPEPPAGVGMRAIATRRGHLLHCGSRLFEIIRSEWPDWAGVRLPEPLFAALTRRGSARIAGGAIRLVTSPLDEALLLTARVANPRGGSEPREHEADAAEPRSLELLAEALEALSLAAFLCDGRGRVRALTLAAEVLLASADGLVLASGRLDASSPSDAKALSQAIQTAASTSGAMRNGAMMNGAPVDSVSRTVVIGRERRQAAPLVLDVLPLPARAAGASRESAACVLVVARGARAAEKRRAAVLGATYGLTPSEIDIALSVGGGTSAERIAAMRGVAVGTVRGQIKAILAKVGVRRQVELAARVAQL